MARLESHMDEALDLNNRFRRAFGHTTYHQAMRMVLP
jgi:hypothetical protein